VSYEILELSPEQIRKIKKEFPAQSPQPFKLMDDGISLGYYPTRGEAEADMRKWLDRDHVDERLQTLIVELVEVCKEIDRKDILETILLYVQSD